ncbi:MAG: GtrA family protein [Erysipelotrichaceae bacterium]
MIEKLWNQYKEVIMYLVFGVLTTLVNIVAYYVGDSILHIHYLIANAIAWVLAVLFAYETNRRWVFNRGNQQPGGKLKEFTMFVSCRLFSGVCDMGIMFVGIDLLGANGLFVKILSNVFVVVINYVFSKFIIFKKVD